MPAISAPVFPSRYVITEQLVHAVPFDQRRTRTKLEFLPQVRVPVHCVS
jgi:hypothetical protein